MASTTRVTAVGILLAVTLAACQPKPSLVVDEEIEALGLETPDFRDWSVGLKPDTSDNSLDIKHKFRGCRSGNDKDTTCIEFIQNQRGYIRFYMQGESKEICDLDDPSKGAKHVITRIELTRNESTNDPTKGDFSGDLGLSSKDESRNFPSLNWTNGVVYERDLAAAESEVWVGNRNTMAANYWYRVTATSCSTGQTFVTDPRLRNGGR